MQSWDTRIPTGRLNTFFKEIVAATPPPVRGGKQPRILFATQATARPPTFVLFTTGFLEAGYRRFLERRLRETFGFEGSPIRINVRVREKRGQVAERFGGARSLDRVSQVPVSHMILIALAGVGAGAINAVVGSGTLITFPTLVALGYPPVTATMSNAVGLVAGGVSGTWGYRRELRGQWDRLRWQIPASLIGAGLGSWLLLHLPETVFEKVVPVLLVLALGLVVVGPRIQEWARRRAEVSGQSPEHVSGRQMAALVFGTFVIGIYGGYFTAAQGIMLIAAMSALLPEDMQRMNAAKNLLSLLVNIVAAVAYTVVAFDRISWEAAGLIAVGSLIGGFLGAHYGRRLSPNALRAAIVMVGAIGLYRLVTV